jgi:hypothetical protein
MIYVGHIIFNNMHKFKFDTLPSILYYDTLAYIHTYINNNIWTNGQNLMEGPSVIHNQIIYTHTHIHMLCVFVGHGLATKVFIG